MGDGRGRCSSGSCQARCKGRLGPQARRSLQHGQAVDLAPQPSAASCSFLRRGPAQRAPH